MVPVQGTRESLKNKASGSYVKKQLDEKTALTRFQQSNLQTNKRHRAAEGVASEGGFHLVSWLQFLIDIKRSIIHKRVC